MGEYDADEFPGIAVVSDPSPSYENGSIDLVHVDDATIERVKHVSMQRYVYIFDDEDKKSDLRQTIDELRQEYIYATGIVFPSWLRGELHDLEDDVIEGIAWMMVFGASPEPEDLDVIREHI